MFVDKHELERLKGYYLRARLDVQESFFHDRARRNVRRDALTRRLPPAPAATFRALWYAERILEPEHREWLRLMTDPEWFG